MNKVILIILKDSVVAEPMIYPPLGLLYIAAVLEKNNYVVEIYDMREEENVLENIPYCEVYGISSSTPQIYEAIRVSKFLRNIYKSFVIIGGHYASWESEKIINDFDSIVVGEGEGVIVEIVRDRKCGIIDARKNIIKDINEIPFPSRHLIPKNRIINENIANGYGFNSGEQTTTLTTSRGCSHKCRFCANIPQKIRFRNADNVLEEVDELIKKYDCKSYKLLDDNFLLNKKNLENICKGFRERNIQFRCAARSDGVTKENCLFLKEAGCNEIALGVEVADDYVLKLMRKKETVEDNKRAIKIIRDCGINIRVYLMVGLPGQTRISIEKTKNFLLETKPERFTVSTFIPYPGCDIWKDPDKFEVKIEKEKWDQYFQLYPCDPPYRTKQFTKEEIRLQQEEMIDFLKELKNK